MKYLQVIALLFCCASFASAQNVTELYKNKDYKELVKLDKNADQLTGEELYMIGFAYFQLEDDAKAVEMYDKAIAKGANDAGVHFYKGISLRYLKKYNEALQEIEIALKAEPANQEYLNEKGMVYYNQEKYDKALEVFEQAEKLPETFPEPWYWAAVIYHDKEQYSKALAGFYEALKHLPKDNAYYVRALRRIGQLEYTTTKDYAKSAQAYAEAIRLNSEDYELYYKLIKSYNAAKDDRRADSVFAVVKADFEKGKLPKEDMEIKTIAVAQFDWNGQVAVVRRSLVDPKETLDITYKVFLLDKAGDKVERRFVVEKTIQLEKDGANYLLCEEVKKTGGHITYPYGWVQDVIPLESLQKAVTAVLDGKMKMGASSRPGK